MTELKICGLEEMLDSLVSIDCDIPAIIVGGWFDFACAYRGAFPALQVGLYTYTYTSSMSDSLSLLCHSYSLPVRGFASLSYLSST